jgi:hypothetical protein
MKYPHEIRFSSRILFTLPVSNPILLNNKINKSNILEQLSFYKACERDIALDKTSLFLINEGSEAEKSKHWNDLLSNVLNSKKSFEVNDDLLTSI